MNQDLTYIIVTMLVPLIPAYIIYRTLPSQTVVRGPFKGLQVQRWRSLRRLLFAGLMYLRVYYHAAARFHYLHS